MKNRLLGALGALALLTIAAVGCSHKSQNSLASALLGYPPITAEKDTTPKPSPGPPPPIPTVVSVGAESTQAGTSGLTQWQLGNAGPGASSMDWTLTSDAG